VTQWVMNYFSFKYWPVINSIQQ